MKIEIAKKSLFVIGFATLLLASGVFYLSNPKPSYYVVQNPEVQNSESQTLEEKFAYLSNAKTNFCAGPKILKEINSDRLQGSCCSPMDFHKYKEQIEGLKNYSYIDKIPSDPYDISRSLAEELLDFQKNIILGPKQQAVYDEAVKLSEEGGPCCCKCWRWYAFEGLAKYLIIEYNFDAQEIAKVWELLDGCGGSSHIHEST